MTGSEEKFTRRRLRSAYISVVVSIALVLFMLGAFGALVLNANEIARHMKENFAVQVMLKPNSSPVAVRELQKSLALSKEVKSTAFISKEEAAQELKEELNEAFVDFLGYNPLYDVIEVRLKAQFVNLDQLDRLEKELLQNNRVEEVVFDRPLIEKMNQNIRRISLVLIGGTVLLALIAIALINSSIRLSIYARRFLIKTMQLVGATKGFIRQPFLRRSLWHGLAGALMASTLLGLAFFYLDRQFPGLLQLQSFLDYLLLGLGIFLVGIFISLSCTFFALKKYLNLKTDQLYF